MSGVEASERQSFDSSVDADALMRMMAPGRVKHKKEVVRRSIIVWVQSSHMYVWVQVVAQSCLGSCRSAERHDLCQRAPVPVCERGQRC